MRGPRHLVACARGSPFLESSLVKTPGSLVWSLYCVYTSRCAVVGILGPVANRTAPSPLVQVVVTLAAPLGGPAVEGPWALGYSSQSEQVLRTNRFASSGEIGARRTSLSRRLARAPAKARAFLSAGCLCSGLRPGGQPTEAGMQCMWGTNVGLAHLVE